MDEITQKRIKQMIAERSGNFRRTTFQRIFFIIALILAILTFISFISFFIKAFVTNIFHRFYVEELMNNINGLSREYAEILIDRLLSPVDYTIAAALLIISLLFAKIAWLRYKIIKRNLYIKGLEDLIVK